ncbi:PLP-dependent aminotransferase family protein [Puniceicoccaceae bacterium K14]|nr:PLP-dependent aminotransferase family protein [Puniceicoccaceae bacterium K14]
MKPNIKFADRVERLTGSISREILSVSKSGNTISFAGGLPDDDFLEGMALPRASELSYQYGASEGDCELRKLFADRIRGLGREVSWKETLVLSGSQQGLDLISKLFLMKGRTVIVESPTYLAALQVFRFFEAKVVGVPLDDEGIDLSLLQKAIETEDIAFVYINPTYQNPSGANYSEVRRRKLAELLNESGTLLIEDDPYRELSFEKVQKNIPVVSRLNTNWIYLNSVSKILVPGLRIGCLACSENLFDSFLKVKQTADLHTSRVSQSIVFQMLQSQYEMDRHLSQLIGVYRAKRDEMARSLAKRMSVYADWKLPEGGMFFWLKLRGNRSSKRLMKSCLKRNVAILSGDAFFAEVANNSRWLRLNFTNPKLEEIDLGIQVLSEEVLVNSAV